MISHVKEWVCTGKNLANNGTHFFGNGAVVESNGTIVGGRDDEQESLSLYLPIIEK